MDRENSKQTKLKTFRRYIPLLILALLAIAYVVVKIQGVNDEFSLTYITPLNDDSNFEGKTTLEDNSLDFKETSDDKLEELKSLESNASTIIETDEINTPEVMAMEEPFYYFENDYYLFTYFSLAQALKVQKAFNDYFLFKLWEEIDALNNGSLNSDTFDIQKNTLVETTDYDTYKKTLQSIEPMKNDILHLNDKPDSNTAKTIATMSDTLAITDIWGRPGDEIYSNLAVGTMSFYKGTPKETNYVLSIYVLEYEEDYLNNIIIKLTLKE